MKTIELLLKTDVPKLGETGNLVRVKPGFARNYLIPKGLGVAATKENIRLIEIEKKRLVQEEEIKKDKLADVAKKLEDTACNIEAKANEEGNLFGSVTYAMIADGYNALGYSVKAENIALEDSSLYPIKELGIFPITIKLHSDITAKSKVWVVKEQE